MTDKQLSTIFHEINSPLTSLKAIALTQPLDPDLKSRLENHIQKITSASRLLYCYISPKNTDTSNLISLINDYAQSQPEIVDTSYTWTISPTHNKKDYQEIVFDVITKLAKLHNVTLKQTSNLLTLHL